MLTDDGKHLYVSWDEYHMLIERLALKIAHSATSTINSIHSPFDCGLRIADCGLVFFKIISSQSAIRNPKSAIVRSAILRRLCPTQELRE